MINFLFQILSLMFW